MFSIQKRMRVKNEGEKKDDPSLISTSSNSTDAITVPAKSEIYSIPLRNMTNHKPYVESIAFGAFTTACVLLIYAAKRNPSKFVKKHGPRGRRHYGK